MDKNEKRYTPDGRKWNRMTPRFDRGESNDFNHSVYVLYVFIYFILDGKMKSAGFF